MRRLFLLFLIFLLSPFSGMGQSGQDAGWGDRKFSMFIHFGLYSRLGGVWEGKEVRSGYSEQIQSHAGIFSDSYADVAGDFNPDKWNADEIVAIARKAGMKSVVFTSKHHDGFCMYHSAHTDFNIVDATPFGRDIMKELADACKKEGLKFGGYFSLIDWHFPQAYPISSHNADYVTPEHHRYNLEQVREILTKYGPVSELWFDMGALTPEQSRELYGLVKSLQPQCMVSGRLGNDTGDFCVLGDNEHPDYKIGMPWQTPASFFPETWGYRSWQERGNPESKFEEKTENLVRVVSRGGNYLLNIGPAGDGSVLPFEKTVLEMMGNWLDTYGEAIYATRANPFPFAFDWGDVTTKGKVLYLFVKHRPEDGKIFLPGLKGEVKSVLFMGNSSVLKINSGKKGITVSLPSEIEKPYAVLRMEFEDGYEMEPRDVLKAGIFDSQNSIPTYSYSSMDYYTGFRSILSNTWDFTISSSRIRPFIYYTEAEKGRRMQLVLDGKSREFVLDGGKEERKKIRGIKFGKIEVSASTRASFSNKFFSSGDYASISDYCPFRISEDFRCGKRYAEPAGEREFLFIRQIIEADKTTEIAVEVGCGNGIQLCLNGQTLAMHTNPRGTDYKKEIFVLPLRKGSNEILIKFYNRFEKEICYSYRPLEYRIGYWKELDRVDTDNKDFHRMELRPGGVFSPNAEARLWNLKMVFR